MQHCADMPSVIPRPKVSRRTSSSPDSHVLKLRASEVSPPSPSSPLKLHRSNSSPPKFSQTARLVNATADNCAATSSRVRTFLRVRPPTAGATTATWLKCRPLKSGKVFIDVDHQKLSERKQYVVDGVLRSTSTQEDVFEAVGVASVANFLAGYNGSIFAYGTSGSGKTHTMHGELNPASDDRGLTLRILDHLFDQLHHSDFTCTCAFVDIYHEKLYDLLDGRDSGPKSLRENTACHQVYVQNLVEQPIRSATDAFHWLDIGCKARKAASNRDSSRSHTVFSIRLTQTKQSKTGTTKGMSSVLHCVDLAGSERPNHAAMNSGVKDATQINKSLSSLANVILALGDVSRGSRQRHVPYRDCKLTFLLREALGGNSTTTVVATVLADDKKGVSDTLATLQFVDRVKHVTTMVSRNEFLDDQVENQSSDGRMATDESVWASAAVAVHPIPVSHLITVLGGDGDPAEPTISTDKGITSDTLKRDSWTQNSPEKTIPLDLHHPSAFAIHRRSPNPPLLGKGTTSVERCPASAAAALVSDAVPSDVISDDEVADVVQLDSVCPDKWELSTRSADTALTKRDSWAQDVATDSSSNTPPSSPSNQDSITRWQCAVSVPVQERDGIEDVEGGGVVKATMSQPPDTIQLQPSATHDSAVATTATDVAVPSSSAPPPPPRQVLSVCACVSALEASHYDTTPLPSSKPNKTLTSIAAAEATPDTQDSSTQAGDGLVQEEVEKPSVKDDAAISGMALFVVGLCLGGCTVGLIVYFKQRR